MTYLLLLVLYIASMRYVGPLVYGIWGGINSIATRDSSGGVRRHGVYSKAKFLQRYLHADSGGG